MNKIITIIVVLAVIGGAVWYFTQGKNQGSSEVKNDSAQVSTGIQTEMQETSIKSLLTQDKDMKCSYELSVEQGTGNGTFYVSKGKSRGDISATVAGVKSVTYVIAKDNTMYMWNDEGTLAMKTTIDQKTSVDTKNSPTAIDPNTNYKFKCESWGNVDQSKFEVPSNLEFKEFNIPAMPTGSSDGKTINPADICNSLPEPAKSQCLAASAKL